MTYLTAIGITLLFIFLFERLAIKIGLVDEPGGRKIHSRPIPLIGGIGVFIGFTFSLLTLNVSLSSYRCLIAVSGLMVFTGLLDDFHELSAKARLFVQFAAGCLAVWWGQNSLSTFGHIFGHSELKLSYFSIPITIFAVTGMINAMNMIDGVDGLAGCISLIQLFYLSCLAHMAHLYTDKQIIDVMLCALLGFMYFNFPFKSKATIFMGDAGSMLLGFFTVWFCIYLSQPGHAAAPPVVFLWVMAVPIFEIISVVLRRFIKKKSPFSADRAHLHYCLIDRGFSSLQTTAIISCFSALLGLIGVLGAINGWTESSLFYSYLVLFLMYLCFSLKFFKSA